MFRKTRLPELLAPAGDMSCLYAAVEAGADAIYVGGKRFGARAFAKNFDTEELTRAVEYCHLHGVKLYVTLNTLVEDREMAEALEYAAMLYEIGVDALIAADLGVIRAIRRNIPNLEIHASTQMSIHNVYGARLAAELGIERVVLARELSRENIAAVVNDSPCEVEVFLHGALCVCHSGQCLFSSMVGGRSGNRGECAQPCRLPYNGGDYPISLKDLSLADHIPALIESGVASLKIEGRMKSPDYVYTVTSIYRRLLDEGRSATEKENQALRRAFSRGGFTDGYYTNKLNSPMTGIRSEEDKQQSRDSIQREFSPIRKKVFAEATLRLNRPAKMTLTDGERSVTVYGAEPDAAKNSPLTSEAVKERLSKMGNTCLSLSPNDVSLTLDEGINLSPSALNSLRREAAAAFQSCRREKVAVSYSLPEVNRVKRAVSAQFMNEASFIEALKIDERAVSKIDLAFLPLSASAESTSLTRAIYLPPVITDSELVGVVERLKKAKNNGVMYALVSNIGQISLVKELGLTPVGDFRMNITNRESRLFYEEMGLSRFLLSPELTLPRARDVGGGVITYGRIPLMITELCFISRSFGCEKCNNACLTDRKGEKFPIIREAEHRNLILNSLPTYMGDRQGELLDLGLQSFHMIFTTESGAEIAEILRAHSQRRPLDSKVRRTGRR